MKKAEERAQPRAELSGDDAVIVKALAKLDGIALGVAVGLLFGLVVFLATVVLVVKGGDVVGPNLGLLSNYFIGYEVTFPGSVIGFIYGFGFGFVLGGLIAFLRNTVIGIYLHLVKLRTSVNAVNDFLDHP
jgi:hypothetical protein